MPNTLTVLGDGAWGTAIALLLARSADNRVRLWSARDENARILRDQRENVRLLPGVRIPDAVELTNDPECARDANLLVEAIPTIYLRSTLSRFRGIIRSDQPLVSLTKGIEFHSFLRPTEIIADVLGSERTAALTRPTHPQQSPPGIP